MTPYFQDVYDHVLRATEWTESLRDLVTTIVETNLTLQGNRLNVITKKVTSWAAIIAVPTAITGFYGQNVPYPGFARRRLRRVQPAHRGDLDRPVRHLQTQGLAVATVRPGPARTTRRSRRAEPAGQATSPYLLQHADNPVDWWAWGDEAFAEARAPRRAGAAVASATPPATGAT